MNNMSPTMQKQMAAADAAVQLDGVSKSFGGVTAVADTWLKVRRGEFLTLLGPSGCGKTTLLNLTAGFLDPDAGELFIGGQRVTDMPPHQRSIGMVFQNYALFPHMNVADNVAFGLKMRRTPREEIRKRVAQALDVVRLSGLGERRPRQLSGGQQQRVALARALVINPDVLLLDEPLSALDKNLRAEMQVELKQIHQRVGITTVFVTHDQGEALSLSDRIAVMSNGVIQQNAAPNEIYRRPANAFVASFIGDINRVAGRFVGRTGTAYEVEIPGGRRVVVPDGEPTLAPGDAVAVYLRPECLSLAAGGIPVAAGTVQAHVYQGTHVDVHLHCGEAGMLHVRVPRFDVIERFPLGSTATIVADLAEALVFPNTGAKAG
jgi:putative spermidine/putrescine transport system ATP-binding protein/spermidine/putrescine transport system ATP-binding protein